MNLATTDKQNAIRNGWSDEERKGRRELAGAMQLRLRTLVVLSDLVRANHESEERPKASATANERLALTERFHLGNPSDLLRSARDAGSEFAWVVRSP